MIKAQQFLVCFTILLFTIFQHCYAFNVNTSSFVRTRRTHFVLNGRSFYFNGFNAYWLMYMASDTTERIKVCSTFDLASNLGTKIVRTWAFSDGGDRPLQYSPGLYNEDMFKALDYVISEANNHGVYLILSLVNNWDDFGGKKQYVQWATDKDHCNFTSNDDFFTNDVVKGYYKNHIKAVLTRINTISGIAYKDDPTIFAWELMNEPRCQSDLSGKIFQSWITEMAAYVKYIDSNHMLEIGLEGFYGESMPERKQFNPGFEVGTDFISNNNVAGIDFTTIHAYPDQWESGKDDNGQLAFLNNWLTSHIEDSGSVIRKPLIVTEFGKSSKKSGYTSNTRDTLYNTVFDTLYLSASGGGPATGALFWQSLTQGMDNFRDGYEVIGSECPDTVNLIANQSQRIANLSGH